MASPQEMMRTMIANLPGKTGKSLEEWVKIAGSAPEQKHGKIVSWLKSEHGMTHGYAGLVSTALLKPEALIDKTPSENTDLVADHYAKKPDLKPIYDKLIECVTAFGTDVEIAPKKAYVSLRRNKQFAIIQPSTKTRIDLGLNLKDVEPDGRLEPDTKFNGMASHLIKLTSVEDVDDELLHWLKSSYDQS